MKSRALATFEIQRPDKIATFQVISAGESSREDYTNDEQPLKQAANIMAGHLNRIIDYPRYGWQSRQLVSDAALAVTERLIQAGLGRYTL